MVKLKILFYCAKPYSLAVTQSLRELARDGETYQSLCFISKKLVPLLANETVTTEPADAVAFNPDIVFCPGNYVHDSIGGIKVQLFHGLGFEKKGHFRIRGFFQVYCTPGPLITERFRKLETRHKTFVVIETGWPKTDLLFRTMPRPEQLQGVPPGTKIILYAPTFSRKLTSVPKIIESIKQLPKENELFVIKLHDLHDKREKEVLTSLPRDRFFFVESPDITPWMQCSDMLIADTGSVVYEYALINERILLVEPKRKDMPFARCQASNIREAIDGVLYGSPGNEKEVKEMMDTIHPYRDGLCARRIMDRVTDPEFVEKGKALPKKSNLFRRMKLRYYDRFRKGYVK